MPVIRSAKLVIVLLLAASFGAAGSRVQADSTKPHPTQAPPPKPTAAPSAVHAPAPQMPPRPTPNAMAVPHGPQPGRAPVGQPPGQHAPMTAHAPATPAAAIHEPAPHGMAHGPAEAARLGAPATMHGPSPTVAGVQPHPGFGLHARDDPARVGPVSVEHVHNLGREQAIAGLHEHDYHVADVHHFNQDEFAAWRGGHWHHGWYNGRDGWWYDVGGVWYPYAAPIFPYPLAVTPLIVPEVPAVVVPPPVLAIAPLPAPPKAAYYCQSASGFYPTVPLCDVAWTVIPAT